MPRDVYMRDRLADLQRRINALSVTMAAFQRQPERHRATYLYGVDDVKDDLLSSFHRQDFLEFDFGLPVVFDSKEEHEELTIEYVCHEQISQDYLSPFINFDVPPIFDDYKEDETYCFEQVDEREEDFIVDLPPVFDSYEDDEDLIVETLSVNKESLESPIEVPPVFVAFVDDDSYLGLAVFDVYDDEEEYFISGSLFSTEQVGVREHIIIQECEQGVGGFHFDCPPIFDNHLDETFGFDSLFTLAAYDNEGIHLLALGDEAENNAYKLFDESPHSISMSNTELLICLETINFFVIQTFAHKLLVESLKEVVSSEESTNESFEEFFIRVDDVQDVQVIIINQTAIFILNRKMISLDAHTPHNLFGEMAVQDVKTCWSLHYAIDPGIYTHSQTQFLRFGCLPKDVLNFEFIRVLVFYDEGEEGYFVTGPTRTIEYRGILHLVPSCDLDGVLRRISRTKSKFTFVFNMFSHMPERAIFPCQHTKHDTEPAQLLQLNVVAKFKKTTRASREATIVAATLQLALVFSHFWRSVARFLSPLSIALPLIGHVGFGLYELGFPRAAKCVKIGLPNLTIIVVVSITFDTGDTMMYVDQQVSQS